MTWEESVKEVLLSLSPIAGAKDYPNEQESKDIDQALARIRDITLGVVPKEVDEDGSQGKWVNGFNDANNAIRKELGGE